MNTSRLLYTLISPCAIEIMSSYIFINIFFSVNWKTIRSKECQTSDSHEKIFRPYFNSATVQIAQAKKLKESVFMKEEFCIFSECPFNFSCEGDSLHDAYTSNQIPQFKQKILKKFRTWVNFFSLQVQNTLQNVIKGKEPLHCKLYDIIKNKLWFVCNKRVKCFISVNWRQRNFCVRGIRRT